MCLCNYFTKAVDELIDVVNADFVVHNGIHCPY
jgi:hypothetical protein